MQQIVILGAGEAGAAAAVALRDAGFQGRVTLVGTEAHAPYERPPLSKDVLLAETVPPPKSTSGVARFADLRIDLLTGQRATSIDRAGHSVSLQDGRVVPYDRLLLTLGAEPRRLPWQSPRLHVLRTYEDALVLRDGLQPGVRVVVVGGGFIGLECAAAAIERGAEVTVVEAAPRLLARAVPEAIAGRIADRHRRAGVKVLTGKTIASIFDTPDGVTVALADGTALDADLVIVGIGAAPTTGLAAEAGLAVADGIRVDATLATSDPDIFAAGDCARFPHPLYDGREIRLEAWRNAIDQGQCAARNMLGQREVYAAVPWFWTDQYDLHMQIAGLAGPDDQVAMRDLGDGALIQFHLHQDGRLLAACGIGRLDQIAREVRLAEMLIARQARPEPAQLADPQVKLKQILAKSG
jgi:3-phenylpropionate/trans-cinnamate dioxygenase ferredoxin reductase component